MPRGSIDTITTSAALNAELMRGIYRCDERAPPPSNVLLEEKISLFSRERAGGHYHYT